MTRIASLFDADVLTAEIDPREAVGTLFAEEEAVVAKAVDKRRDEFRAGRVLARDLLRRLGRPAVAIPNGEDRAPRWPAGIVATISHTHGYCAVAMAPDEGIEGLGLDVEQAEPLRKELFRMICTPAEREWLAGLGEERAGQLGKLVFSAKECAYKCQYARSRTFLGFQAMRIEIDEPRGAFTAVFEQPAGEHFAPGDRIEGRFKIEGGLVLTGTTLRRRALS